MARQLTSPAPTAAGQLPPRRSPWPARTVLSLGAGVGAYGIAPLMGYDHLGGLGLGAGTAAAAGCAVLGTRARRRSDVVDDLVGALSPLLGLGEPTREAVRASRWSSYLGGIPTRLVISYGPGVDDTAIEWHTRIRTLVERCLGAPYTIQPSAGPRQRRGRRRRRELILVTSPVAVSESLDPKVQEARTKTRWILGEAAEVNVVKVDDQVHELQITHNLGRRAAEPRFRRMVDNQVNALLEGRWRVSWELTEGTVKITRRPVMPTSVPHLAAPITNDNRLRIPLAQDEDNGEVVWDLRTTPHMVIVGKTGRGKTVAINGIVMELARRGFKVRICDPKQIEFMGMRTWPNVEIVATTAAEMVATIMDTHTVMHDRYAKIKDGRARPGDFPRLVLVLDEYRNFHRQVAAWWSTIKAGIKGMPSRCPVFEWIDSIAEMGRSAGVHLIIGTQRPDADFFGGATRDNFEGRLALGPLSPQGAQMMWESVSVGVAIPRKIKGRGTGILENGQPGEVQVLWTPDPYWAEMDEDAEALALLEPLRPESLDHPRLEIELGDERDIDGNTLPEWSRFLEARLVPAGSAAITRKLIEVTTPPPAERYDEEADTDAAATNGAADVDEYAGDYEDEHTTSAEQVEIGDLLLYDEEYGLWAVVEAVDTDEDDVVRISWRGDEGDFGDLGLDAGHRVTVRSPLEAPTQEEDLG